MEGRNEGEGVGRRPDTRRRMGSRWREGRRCRRLPVGKNTLLINTNLLLGEFPQLDKHGPPQKRWPFVTMKYGPEGRVICQLASTRGIRQIFCWGYYLLPTRKGTSLCRSKGRGRAG
jgi:hypothetical protein